MTLMGQTCVEKIVQRFSEGRKGQKVRSGNYVFIRPAYVMTHDNTAPVIEKFYGIGVTKVKNPRQLVLTLDHNIQDKSPKNLDKYHQIEQFATQNGIDFFPAGRGIGHQIMCEEGYAWPGTMVVASDSHSNMYGGLGCLGTPVTRTDASALWATGKTWWQVPPVAKVILTGKLLPGVTGKDVIISLCGLFNHDEVLNHAVEFSGEGHTGPHGSVSCLTMNDRMTIANMTTEWGALAGLFPADEITVQWLRNRAEAVRSPDARGEHPRLNETRIRKLEREAIFADSDAFYAKELSLDLSSIRPHVSGPDQVKVITSLSEIEKRKIRIDKAYLVSCVNSRVDDISEAAKVVRGKKVAEGVKFYISAASSEVQSESEKRGDWQELIHAGAIPLPPGCGPCIGLGAGILEPGEVAISATNRNFKGRMGSREAQTYLASPAVVAASAVRGFIAGPTPYDDVNPIPLHFGGTVPKSPSVKSISKKKWNLLSSFPSQIRGELLLCPQDNLNTDGIFPAKYTYVDNLSPEEQAKVVMENTDPNFIRLVKKGDILVSGFNFGTGSSREQAVTALKFAGIQLIIAGSFSNTYHRNAINNGFLLIPCPALVEDLKKRIGKDDLTIRTGIEAVIQFDKSCVFVQDRVYSFPALGRTAQEILIAGGLVNWVKRELSHG